MSDEFDREAEKEKLRKQLEAEEEARASTQRMSDLLLKGATMTNIHCEECGDPIFRDQGQAFCPTCERPVEMDDGAGETEDPDGPPEPDTPRHDTADPDTPAGRESSGIEAATSADSPTGSPGIEARTDPPSKHEEATQSTQVPGDLAEARAALARTVTTLAREAEATDDVSRARSLLAAVREGAEAMAAVDSIGR